MDVSGRGASTRTSIRHEQGSDEYTTGNQCEQCQEDALSVAADGYCVDCGHYLCNSCIRLHRKLKMSKDHTVLTGNDMPQTCDAVKCSKHPNKPVELYCESDDTLGCVLCFTIEHKSCQNVRPISVLSKDVESSQDLKDINMASQQHDTAVELYRKLIAECHVVNDECHDKSLDDFQSFRAEIEELLDHLGEAVKAEARAFKETNKKNLDSLSEQITSLDKEMVSFMTDVKMKRKLKQTQQLFITLKANIKSIKDKVKKLQQFKKNIQVQRYVFREHSTIKQGLEKMFKTGIQKFSMVDTYSCTGKINVKSPDDNKDCSITGLVGVSSTRMVITDYDNRCLKLIDVDQGTVTTKRSLTSDPIDVTVIPGSRVAVAVPDLGQLQFFTADTDLKPCGHIATGGRCMSVESAGDRLVVGYWKPPKVQIMDLSGQVRKSFSTDASGNPLFQVPAYLSLSPDRTAIFISDRDSKTVTKMSTEGVVEWVYRDNNDLRCPNGVATGLDGCLYICNSYTNSLHVVSATGVRQTVVHEDQLKYPRAICYSEDENVLYVTSVSYSSTTDPAYFNFIRRFTLQ